MVDILSLAIEMLNNSSDRLKEKYLEIKAKYRDIDWEKKKELLIAEDNKDLQVLYEAGFKSLYDITMVDSVERLREELLRKHYAIAILDEYLLGGKASDLLDVIKSSVDVAVFISAVDIRELEQHKEIIVLQKPLGIMELYNCLVKNA